jgi:hypothetical protein
MFQFPGLSSVSYGFRYRWYRITGTGLPHSEICGYLVISTYPQLIAGSHVLHRLLVPRHPPYALSNLTENFYSQIVCALSVCFYGSVKFFRFSSENIFTLSIFQRTIIPDKSGLVELIGIEPITSALQGRRSPN